VETVALMDERGGKERSERTEGDIASGGQVRVTEASPPATSVAPAAAASVDDTDHPVEPPLKPISRAVPLTIAMALFIEFLDASLVATALPSMARDLQLPAHALSLTITVYLVSLAVVVPGSGWLADRFGARRTLVTAIIIFLCGSTLAGFSRSMPELLTGRAMQGAAGALMMPVGRLIILKTVPRHQLMQAWVWLTMPALIGPMMGPPLAGLIVTIANWRWIFWINIPIGIVGALVALAYLPDVKEKDVPPFDIQGFILSATAIACGVFALEAIGRKVFPAWTSIALAVASLHALILYLQHARAHPRPLIDTTLFRLPTFRASVIGGFIFRIAVGASPFLLPLQLQIGFGQSALRAGLTVFVGALGAMAVKPVVAPLVQRFGFKRMLIVNAIIAACLMSALSLVTATTPQYLTMLLIFLGGFFRSLEFTTLATMSYADVERDRMSRATTVASMFQQISMSFGVAVAAGLLHALPTWRGASTTSTVDFSAAFLIVGILSGLSSLIFAFMPANAGAALLLENRKRH
jgi:EmrB/QacA subfamily drug resistance transporter